MSAILKKSGIILYLFLLWMPFFLEARESMVLNNLIEDEYCFVYFFPQVLNRKDHLQDGPDSVGNQIKIKGDTFLVWIDLKPHAYFCHDTLYILISKQGVRIVEGQWWPVLNNKKILYGEKDKYTLLTPFSTSSSKEDNINVYIYPHELYPSDQLVDGYSSQEFAISDNTFLIWVDLLPGYRFTHPTTYILVSKESTRVVKGGWWPVLNGRNILYGDLNKVGVVSPFLLMSQQTDKE
ncbi:MAG: hypothetical protein JW755_12365 [Candidatus Aminicenantes bacterium]|nr:hypothetical protein [Candidatus Aminicenantes bacterium]